MSMQNQPTTEQENQAIARICVLAAFADGEQDERERAQIEQIVKGWSGQGEAASAYQDVLSGRLTLAQLAAQLQTASARALAYEMAVCVCHADGVLKDSETQFLAELHQALGLDQKVTEPHQQAAQALIQQPLASPAPPLIDAGREEDVEQMVLHTAILTGALELMPHSLATMAIVPIQIRMVYKIGKRYGFELDRGHIGDFLATVGVGLTSQVFEGFSRRLVGGLARGLAGGLFGGLAGQAAGSAFSFATTYALGQVAKQYYSGGRTLTTQQLKQVFSSMLDQGRSLQGRYTGDIARKSQQVNVSQLLPLVRQT